MNIDDYYDLRKDRDSLEKLLNEASDDDLKEALTISISRHTLTTGGETRQMLRLPSSLNASIQSYVSANTRAILTNSLSLFNEQIEEKRKSLIGEFQESIKELEEI